MARIINYANDATVIQSDKLVGSNADGTTKNFSVKDISQFLRDTNAAGVAGQLPYTYKLVDPPGPGGMYVNGSDDLALAGITSLKVSKYRSGDTANSMANYLETFEDKLIILSNTVNFNNFGIFTCSDVSQVSSTDYYTLTLSASTTQGNLENDVTYAISYYSIDTTADKNHVHTVTEAEAASSWSITHNLGKYPSVTIVNSSGVEVYAQVTHNSTSALTISFVGNQFGKAYIN